MILRLLRLFPAFTEVASRVTGLESDLTAARDEIISLLSEKRLLEDRLEQALADRERVWDAMQSALDNERFAMHTQINHLVQKSGGGIPYPDAHRLPENSVAPIQVPGPLGRRGRILPSQAAYRQTMDNLHEMFKDTAS